MGSQTKYLESDITQTWILVFAHGCVTAHRLLDFPAPQFAQLYKTGIKQYVSEI